MNYIEVRPCRKCRQLVISVKRRPICENCYVKRFQFRRWLRDLLVPERSIKITGTVNTEPTHRGTA